MAEEALQHRRHEVQHADPLFGHQLCQIVRVLVTAGFCRYQAGTCHQRPEELPDRYIERIGRLLQHPVAVTDIEAFLHPEDTVRQARMVVHHPLGQPRRARRIDHIGKIVRAEFHIRVARIGSASAAAPGIVDTECPALMHRQHVQQSRPRHHNRRRRVLDHESQPVARQFRVQRHIGTTRLHHRQQRHHQVDGAFQRHTDTHVTADAGAQKPPRQGVRPAVQLAIAKLNALEPHGSALRMRLRQTFKRPVHRLEPAVITCRRVHAVQKPRTLRCINQRNRRHRTCTARCQPRQNT